LSPEDEKYYENYFDIFITDGWKQLVDDISSILSSHRIEDIQDENSLFYLKGERAALSRIVNFEDSIKRVYDEIKEYENAP
jgi:hypothetical protein